MAFKGEEELPKAIILDLADNLFLAECKTAGPEVKAAALETVMGLIKTHGAFRLTSRTSRHAGHQCNRFLIKVCPSTIRTSRRI